MKRWFRAHHCKLQDVFLRRPKLDLAFERIGTIKTFFSIVPAPFSTFSECSVRSSPSRRDRPLHVLIRPISRIGSLLASFRVTCLTQSDQGDEQDARRRYLQPTFQRSCTREGTESRSRLLSPTRAPAHPVAFRSGKRGVTGVTKLALRLVPSRVKRG